MMMMLLAPHLSLRSRTAAHNETMISVIKSNDKSESICENDSFSSSCCVYTLWVQLDCLLLVVEFVLDLWTQFKTLITVRSSFT